MHLLAVWNAAQVVRADPDTVDRYQGMLREHLEKWPTQQTAHQVRRWLGDLYVSQGNMEGAVQAYRGITADSELHLAAVTDLAACWQRWLRQLERDGRPTAAIVADAMAFFDAILFGSGPEPRWPERWSSAQLAAALAATRLRIAYVPDGLADAQKVLVAALENAPDDAQAWRQEANALLIVALAGQPGREQEALALLQRQKMTAADLLQLIDNLTACATNAAAELKPALARVQLAVLERLDAEQPSLDASQRLRTEQLRADTLQLLGKMAEALQIYRRLAARHRDDRAVQLQLAQLLLEAQDEPTLTEAISQWQNVARRLRPDSDDWYRARYSLALALYKRNRPAQGQELPDRVLAAQRLRYLQSTSKVEQTRWGPRVAELLRRCEGN
jgi:tetratricopeptide (TPR) repeat protein